jgi:hypothetical protein
MVVLQQRMVRCKCWVVLRKLLQRKVEVLQWPVARMQKCASALKVAAGHVRCDCCGVYH